MLSLNKIWDNRSYHPYQLQMLTTFDDPICKLNMFSRSSCYPNKLLCGFELGITFPTKFAIFIPVTVNHLDSRGQKFLGHLAQV